MATLYVRGVPDDLYGRLRRQAASSRRSISAEAIEALGRALEPAAGSSLTEVLSRADAIRERSRLAEGGPTTVELLREDRDR